jgi:glycosyltransferase involved in cell wall biosynthesis
MRVLYDISTIGLGHLYEQSRGGAYRAELRIAEGLAEAKGCELRFCANHSIVACHACRAFLDAHPILHRVPLVSSGNGPVAIAGAAAAVAHRRIRRLFGTNVLPTGVRRVARLIDRRLHAPARDSRSAADIFHTSPMAPFPPAERRTARRVLTIYDLAFLRFPAIYGAAYRRSLEAALRSLRAGDHVITTSNFVRDELAANGVAGADRIHVVPLAADPSLFSPCDDPERLKAVRRKYGIPDGPYALGVNTPDARKNVDGAIEAFALAAVAQHGGLSSFVLAGHRGSNSDGIQAAIARFPGLRGRIIVTGFVADRDLAPLYTGARIFVYSSIYEGFGLPPLEAMQCGTPVITTNAASLPEVVADGGIMVPPDDLEALAAAMLRLAADEHTHADLRQRALAQAHRFTWGRSVAATLAAYRTAMS